MTKQIVLCKKASEKQPVPLLIRSIPDQHLKLAAELTLLGSQSSTQFGLSFTEMRRFITVDHTQRRKRCTHTGFDNVTALKYHTLKLAAELS
jgi:hypothetical protein